ncbi:myosin light chain kinase 3-like isoform X2 [Erpetoichthys calabaricus]|uniref:myosin light chain kinase 3-like isoform X2 n=1 Tax=Erpetoichthys calabaricus TaxID=27687 RepID=UPI002234BC33|nr:myosin light chain kinase 3-like isoform X2 [Erpetoichthys calabaricus]
MSNKESQSTTFVNSLAKIYDPNAIQNHGPTCSTGSTCKKIIRNINNSVDNFNDMDIKIDTLGCKMDKLINIQEKVLNRLDSMAKDIEVIEDEVEVLKASKQDLSQIQQAQEKVTSNDIKDVFLEITTLLSSMDQRSEQQTKRLDGVEKIVLGIQQLINFVGETIKTSRITEHFFKEKCPPKPSMVNVSAVKDNRPKQPVKRHASEKSDTIWKKRMEKTAPSAKAAHWTQRIRPHSDLRDSRPCEAIHNPPRRTKLQGPKHFLANRKYRYILKDHKVKDGKEKQRISLKVLKSQKKKKTLDVTESSVYKKQAAADEKVNQLNRQNAERLGKIFSPPEDIQAPSKESTSTDLEKKPSEEVPLEKISKSVVLEKAADESFKKEETWSGLDSTKVKNSTSVLEQAAHEPKARPTEKPSVTNHEKTKEKELVPETSSDEELIEIQVQEEEEEGEVEEEENEEEEQEEEEEEQNTNEDVQECGEEDEIYTEDMPENEETSLSEKETSDVIHENTKEEQELSADVLNKNCTVLLQKYEDNNEESIFLHLKEGTDEAQMENREVSELSSSSKRRVTEEELVKAAPKKSRVESQVGESPKSAPATATNEAHDQCKGESGQGPQIQEDTVKEYVIDTSHSPLAPFEHRIVSAKPAPIASFYAIDKQEIIGGGRFGQVHKCTEKSSGLTLAAKIIKARGSKEKEEVKNEIQVMNQLNHANLIQLYAAFESKYEIVLVMEYVEGGELFDRIIDENCNLTELDTILFIKQICDGIQYMHQMYILHLDLKPENILCVDRATNKIKIIDFGLARRYKPREKLKVNFGTPEFLAPEVINYDFVSFPTDMWSLGVITYMLLSGLSPFLGENDNETLNNILSCRWDFEEEEFKNVSEEAKDFIRKLLIKDKSWRISATESLKHPWLSDRSLHYTLHQQAKSHMTHAPSSPQ